MIYLPIYEGGELLWGEEPGGEAVIDDPTTVTPEDETDDPVDPVTGNYLITYNIAGEWDSGATVRVILVNNTDQALDGWRVAFNFDDGQEVINLWNGKVTQTDSLVTVDNIGYNATVPANGGTRRFGFNLSHQGTNNIPTSFTVNGVEAEVGN